MSTDTTAIILAGGFGRRIENETAAQGRPKPMITYQGKPVLEHNVELCKKHGVKNIVLSIHHLPEVVREYFGDGSKWGLKIDYCEETQPMGTAGAVRLALEQVQTQNVLVIYGDNFSQYNFAQVIEEHTQKKADVSICGHELEDVQHSGVAVFGEGGWIKQFVEKPAPGTEPSKWVNMGVYVFSKALGLALEKNKKLDFGKEVFPLWLGQQKKILAQTMPEKVVAFDTPAMLQTALKN